jgi:hypothetical protein
MKWPQWYPTRADLLGIFFAAVVVCLFAFAMIRAPYPRLGQTNAGFGPDWECTDLPQGGPVCIKKLSH